MKRTLIVAGALLLATATAASAASPDTLKAVLAACGLPCCG